VNDHDTESALVLAKVRDAFDGVTMATALSDIVTNGQARRRRRRLLRAVAITSVAALAAVGIAIAARPAPASRIATADGASGLHIQTVAYTLDTQPDGTIKVTWTKQAYVQDPGGLQGALRRAGFPVLIKVGEFCKGPADDGYLDPSGQGHGVDTVMQASGAGSDVVFTFKPAAMPPGTELFIGYLSPAQLAVTHGRPGSVERLVPTGTTLVCTTQAPPAH
jgi:hypothetical protein